MKHTQRADKHENLLIKDSKMTYSPEIKQAITVEVESSPIDVIKFNEFIVPARDFRDSQPVLSNDSGDDTTFWPESSGVALAVSDTSSSAL